MERSLTYLPNNYYHIYNRGINKREIFFDKNDWKHFQTLLYTRNSTKRIDSTRVKRLPLHKIDRGETIVDLAAYVLMPNHFHLLLKEKVEGGISSFMGKLGTAYSMYINTKYERSGPLMCRPYRSKYIDSDEYMRWVLSYIHMNPVKKNPNISQLNNYHYSSYPDYYQPNRPESTIINKECLPFSFQELEDINSMLNILEN